MPIAADLVFFRYLAFAAAVVLSAIGLVIRHKWRMSAARAEEVRRLLVLATEESARAELEASSSAYVAPPSEVPIYYSSSKEAALYHHQCAVCFNPSTTRCSRCKAVRYCSGKCQIIHWRQGHKRDCQPFTSIYQNDYTGDVPTQKISEKENEINANDIGNNGQDYASYIQTSPVKSPLLKPDMHVDDFSRNGESEVEPLLDRDEKDSNLDQKEKSNKLQLANALPVKLSNNIKSIDQNGTTTSYSGSSADGSTESSFPESSTLSDFCDENIDPRRTKFLDTRDDSSQSSSSDAEDAEMHTSQSSLKPKINISWDNITPVDGQNSSPKVVISKGTIYRAVLSEEKIEDASTDYLEKSDCIGPSITPKSSRLMSLSTDRLDDIGDTTSTLSRIESIESGNFISKFSIANSSTAITHSLDGAKSLKVVSAHAGGASSNYANHSLNGRSALKISTCKVVDNLKFSKISTHNHSTVGGEIAGRYTNKGLFSYDVFVKLYNWNKIEMRPSGLTNCGNSCYANAVLQCLAFTPPLTAYLLQGLHSKACEKKEWCFTCEFESLIMKVREGISSLSPVRLLSEIQKIGSRLGNGKEEDAHEFLRYAIDNMQYVCLKDALVNEPSSLEEETTLIGLTFGGYLRSKIKCMRCGGKSERHERMMDLTVEIEGDIETLEAALRKFTKTEILDGENKYQCSRCGSYEKAKKKLKVQEAPNILTIALKRFQSGKFGKLNKPIQFPEILDLAPYMSGTSDKSPIYKLYGVVVHLDVMNATFSGHYVCYVKNLQNKWFKVDDSVVTSVERVDVLSKRAYMLLYARCSPRAPRLIKNSIILPDPRKAKNPLLKLRSLSTGPWDEPSNRIDSLYSNHSSVPHSRRILEDDSSSEISSSLFSEVCSSSTESSNRDSSSTDEFFDHLFGDSDQNWNTMWKQHSSDSDTSSSSSSSSSPSPLYAKRSPLSDLDKYSSEIQNGGLNKDNNIIGVRNFPSPNSCTTKQCRNLESNSSNGSSSSCCRETDSDRLGLANALGGDKSY